MRTFEGAGSPSLVMLGIEPMRAMLEFARMHLCSADDHPKGDGHAVVLFPGLGTDDKFMVPLARHCQRLGYDCLHWGRGRNAGPQGDPASWVRELAAEVDELTAHNDGGVTLIGWSLGGFYAREIAKAMPARARQVITLGCPFAQIADSTNVSWLYELLSGAPRSVPERYAKELRRLPPVPTTSIYSRSDGVVAWKACRVKPGAIAQNVEVDSSHLGLVWHPEVLKIVADRLAQPAAAWKSWRPADAPDGGASLAGAAA